MMNAVESQPALAAQSAGPAGRSRGGTALGAIAIFLLTVAMQLPLLGSAPLGGTEGHRVFPALDMVRTGDWILPRLYGQLYLIKPPFHDWLIALAQILSFHHGNEFVWRLPSVIGAGILNAALYLFGARWFGRIGGIVSGLGGLALVALWLQARAADVDSTNTTACTIAALCLIELLFGHPKRRWPWVALGGIALGATLLTKGPAGLPLIIGILAWAGWRARRDGTGRALLRSPGFWGPLAIGVALFAAYAVAAKLAILRLHRMADYSGFEEVGNKLVPDSLGRIAQALLLPPQVFAYALPVSLALPLVFLPGFRDAIRDSQRDNPSVPRARIVQALAASILISWGICLLTGMVNPRYAYVTIAPLALLAGALAAAVPYMKPGDSGLIRVIALGTVVTLAAANWFVAGALAWRRGQGHVAMLVAASLATLLAVSVFRRLRAATCFRAAWGIVPLLVLLAVPFAYQFRADRFDRSGYAGAKTLRAIVGPGDPPVLAGAVLHSEPELFWYAGLRPQVVPTFAIQNPGRYTGGRWVVMDKEEHKRWSIFAARRLTHIEHFLGQPKYPVFVGWYEPQSATSQPTAEPSTTAPSE